MTHEMTITKLMLWHIGLPMRFTFRTSQGALSHRESLIVGVTTSSGYTGYGEVVAFTEPFYTAETLTKSKDILLTTWLPFFVGKRLTGPWTMYDLIRDMESVGRDVSEAAGYDTLGHGDCAVLRADERGVLQPLTGDTLRAQYPMAWAGLENALLHAYYGEQGVSTIGTLVPGEKRNTIESGVVLGDMPIPDLLKAVDAHVAKGCKRIKLKLKPGDAVARVAAVRKAHPDIILAGDANCSFSPEQADEIIALNPYKLRSLEEPFMVKDEAGNYKSTEVYSSLPEELREAIKTPLCFDESVQSLAELKAMHTTGWLDVLNIKVGRLGGLRETVRCLDYCRSHNIGFWIGSMVESGVSKYMHVQLATLADTWMAGDLSDMSRYFEKDIITTPIEFSKGSLAVDFKPGLGTDIDEAALDEYTLDKIVFE